MAIVADIETVQSQLAKPAPNAGVLRAAWTSLQAAATLGGCADLVHQIGGLIAPLITGSS
ncbi:MAG: hypothetical protein WAK11_00980 [Candidatus Cybelea sp.]